MYWGISCAAAALLVAIAAQPANAEGSSVCTQGTANEPIAACSRRLALDPKLVFAHNNRGNSYTNKGAQDQAIADYDQAIADFDQALKLNPSLAIARQGPRARTGVSGKAVQSRRTNERAAQTSVLCRCAGGMRANSVSMALQASTLGSR
jgi:tetratricopeptide (TPR) repeat protein